MSARRFTTRPELKGSFGAVSSTHWLASQSAMAVLERGGNAFDAAFAGAMVLQVCEPHLNGPGGDCPILVHAAREGRTRVICGQGPLPGAATLEAYTRHGLDTVPGTGLLAAVVPGAFGAWTTLLRDYGTWSFAEAMDYAIGYAERGIPVLPQIAATVAAAQPMFQEFWPSSAAVFLDRGAVPAVGSLFRNPTLAETWRRLVGEAAGAAGREAGIEAARAAWYHGFVAEAVDRFCRDAYMDVSGEAHAGLLTGQDLADWTVPVEDPVEIEHRGFRVQKCGFWSQGPVLLQALRILEDVDLASLDPEGAAFVHWVAEAKKLAYADRETFYGDPDFVSVPGETLLSRDYAAARRALIDPGAASRDWRPGAIEGHGMAVDYAAACARRRDQGLLAGYGGGEPTVARFDEPAPEAASGDTCHLDVADRDGNMISVTPSGGWLQSSPVIPELGFALGTRAQMLWLVEGAPNAPAPRKRPRTTLTPTMVLRDDGTPYLACGTPGGDQQDQWQLVFLLRHLHHGMNLQEAIDAPAFHSEHWPNSFYPRQASPGKLVVEERFADPVKDRLRALGHDLHVGEPWSEGRLAAAGRDADGQFKAAANPRGMQGYAVAR